MSMTIQENIALNYFRQPTIVPAYLLQGDLFPATRFKERTKKNRRIKTFLGQEIEIYDNGLSQFDLAVSLAYKKIINRQNSFNHIVFTLADFSFALNRCDGGKSRKLILEAFTRNQQLHLSFESHGTQFNGYRFNQLAETQAHEFMLSINLEYLTHAYVEKNICHLDTELLLNLPKGLHSWLYGFIASLPNITQIDIDNLYGLSGSQYKNQGDFKKAVKLALSALYQRDVIGWRHGISRHGMVFWEYKNPFLKIN